MFCIGFFYTKKMSDSLIPSFLVSDVSESLRSLTKNEQCEQIAQSEKKILNKKFKKERKIHFLKLLNCFIKESLIRSFLGKKRAIRFENR